MQDDHRNLSVAREHLKSAYDEVMRAQGWTEREMSESALARALDQLNLVVRRLQQQRNLAGRGEFARAVEAAFARAELAWQSVQKARQNGGGTLHDPLLEQARAHLVEAMETVDEAIRMAETKVAPRS